MSSSFSDIFGFPLLPSPMYLNGIALTLTRQSWLDVARWYSLSGFQSNPWIFDKWPAMYCTGLFPFCNEKYSFFSSFHSDHKICRTFPEDFCWCPAESPGFNTYGMFDRENKNDHWYLPSIGKNFWQGLKMSTERWRLAAMLDILSSKLEIIFRITVFKYRTDRNVTHLLSSRNSTPEFNTQGCQKQAAAVLRPLQCSMCRLLVENDRGHQEKPARS